MNYLFSELRQQSMKMVKSESVSLPQGRSTLMGLCGNG